MTFRPSSNEDLESSRAINAVRYQVMDQLRGRRHPRDGRQPFPFQVKVHRNGYVVTAVRMKSPLAVPSVRAKYAHYPRYAWIAWKHGKPMKMQVRFMCGGYSWTARGVTEVENQLPVCVKCRLVVAGPEPVAACLDRIEAKK